MGLPQPEGFLFWYTTSAILGLLTLINVAGITIRWLTRRSGAKRTMPQLPSTPSSPATSSRSASLTSKEAEEARGIRKLGPMQRFGRAFTMGADQYIGLSTIPVPRLRWWIKRKQKSSIPTVELAWTIVYTLGCLLLSFYGSKSHSCFEALADSQPI